MTASDSSAIGIEIDRRTTKAIEITARKTIPNAISTSSNAALRCFACACAAVQALVTAPVGFPDIGLKTGVATSRPSGEVTVFPADIACSARARSGSACSGATPPSTRISDSRLKMAKNKVSPSSSPRYGASFPAAGSLPGSDFLGRSGRDQLVGFVGAVGELILDEVAGVANAVPGHHARDDESADQKDAADLHEDRICSDTLEGRFFRAGHRVCLLVPRRALASCTNRHRAAGKRSAGTIDGCGLPGG
ncbi:MAG: hypothetical protein R3D59_17040 [Paracoccaceae bacterium]